MVHHDRESNVSPERCYYQQFVSIVRTGTVSLTVKTRAGTLRNGSPALHHQAEYAWVAHAGHVRDDVGVEAPAPVQHLHPNVSFPPPSVWAAPYSENPLQVRVIYWHGM